jgi:hypothetical protein
MGIVILTVAFGILIVSSLMRRTLKKTPDKNKGYSNLLRKIELVISLSYGLRAIYQFGLGKWNGLILNDQLMGFMWSVCTFMWDLPIVFGMIYMNYKQ